MNLSFNVALFFFCLSCILYSACKKDKHEAPILSFEKTSFLFPAESGRDSVLLTANVSWSISSKPSWLSIAPSEGNGDAKIVMTYEANTARGSRSASLVLKAAGADSTTIQLTQAGATPYLTTDKSLLTVLATTKTDSIIVSSNLQWKLTIPVNAFWLKASIAGGDSGSTKVILSFTENTNPAPRQAVFTIEPSYTTAVFPIPIEVNQAQPDVVIYHFTPKARGESDITISGTGFSINPQENNVKINGQASVVKSSTRTSLLVKVPPKAGSGPIIVSVNTKADTASTNFDYEWTGIATVFAGGAEGYADGMGTNAMFVHPAGLDFDATGNLYVADYANSKIRKIDPSGNVTTLPGRVPAWNHPTGPNTDFGLPQDVAVDALGNIYVAEVNACAISKISNNGVVTLIAGGNAPGFSDGTGTSASFYWPSGVDIDASGNIWVADSRNSRIRKINSAGVVTTIAGSSIGYADGTGTSALFNLPYSIRLDATGNLLVADNWNNRIRKLTTTGVVSTISGYIYEPQSICRDGFGNIYTGNGDGKIHWLTPSGELRSVTSTITFSVIQGVAVDASGLLYVADYYNNRIYKVVIQ